MTTTSLGIVDFHSHFVDPRWALTITSGLTGDRLKLWQRIGEQISDEAALLKEVETGDIAGRVVNTPASFISGPGGEIDADTVSRINDGLAGLIERHPGKLYGLATVDAYAGEAAARELERAVRELGLRGVFVDSAKGNLLIDAPQARPVLAAAAELGVPVFVHPVNPEPLTTQLAPYGRLGTLLARGTVNAAALAALVAGGTLDELPKLKVVFTALSIGGILLAHAFGEEDAAGRDVRATLRRNVYVDVMGFDPTVIRAAIDTLGVDHVLAGSDWPIVNDGPINAVAHRAFAAAGVGDQDWRKIASQNALRLLAPRH